MPRQPQLLLRCTTRPGVHLVSRPRGVVHAYAGPLTRSGRCVPRTGRAVCHTRTRRLRVLDSRVVGVEFATGRVIACGRCSVHLVSPEWTEQHSRDDARTVYAALSAFDLALLAYLAVSEAEVEFVEWLVLLLVGYPACVRTPVVAPTGKTTGPLDSHTRRARVRLDCTHDAHAWMRATEAEHSENAEIRRRAANREAWETRERLIEQLGISNVITRPRR